MQDLASVCDKMVPPIRALISLHEFEDATLVVAEIPETPLDNKPCYYAGAGLTNGAYIRVADGDRRLGQYEVQVMLASRGQPRADSEPVEGTTVRDLHGDLSQALLDRLRRTRPQLVGRSDDEILRRMGVTTDGPDGHQVLSLAGLLSLGEFPQAFFPELCVTFVAYPTPRIGVPGPRGERFADQARIEGPIPLMIEPTLSILQRNMKQRSVVHGLAREDHWEYPITALREAVVNALVHRDLGVFARGTPIQIQLFPDRLVVMNPGGLHGPVTVEMLGDSGVSSSRNATLMRLLEDTPVTGAGYLVCENRGSGIGAMLAALRTAGMTPPEFKDFVATFRVTFPNHTLFDQPTLTWLASIGGEDLTENQRVALALLWNGGSLSNETFRKFADIDSRKATRELRHLVRLGLVETRSAGRWTTYLLTDSGDSSAQAEIFPADSGSLSDGPSQVLGLLRQRGAMARADLDEALGTPPSTTRYWLRALMDEGLVERTTRSARSPNAKYRPVRRSGSSVEH